MKQCGFKNLTSCLMAVLALSLATNAQAELKAANAKVRAIRGTTGAQVSVNGGGWTNLKVNDTLQTGSYIRTGSDATVDVFVNNSVVRITPDTTMGIDKMLIEKTGLDTITQTQLNIRSGKVVGNVKKLASTSRYEVKTPNGVAGIRGTDFQITCVQVEPGKYKLQVTSITGTIVGSAVNRSGVLKTAVINTGETWDPDQETIQLLDAETLAQLQKIIKELPTGSTVEMAIVAPETPQTQQHVSPSIGE